MIAAIRLDITTGAAECDICPAHNAEMRVLRDKEDELTYGVATAIYRLTIGAGFRQPSYLCPDCLNKLRGVLGVSSGIAVCRKCSTLECHCPNRKEGA